MSFTPKICRAPVPPCRHSAVASRPRVARPPARRLGISLLALVPLTFSARAQVAPAEAEALFARRVWPMIQDKCLPCHGKDEEKIKGGLDLRTLAGAREGGDSFKPAFKAGDPATSPLHLAITRASEDFEPMPPKENDALSAAQIDYVRDWIAAGAPWPDEARRRELLQQKDRWSEDDGIPVATSGGLSDDWTQRHYKPENLWAYQPLRKPPVPGAEDGETRRQRDGEKSPASSPSLSLSPAPFLPVSPSPSLPTHPIDAFLAAHRTAPGVAPAPAADRRTLLRRATYDLTGLPPTPAEFAAFLADPAPTAVAFARVVDRLLASPHYGEQWGRHWLDVARYADSSGFANDFVRGNTWRYRDYVIRAFNADKPYDQFVREQIAGDEIDPTNPELLVATGFLRMGPWELTGMEVAKIARQRFLDDVTDTVGQAFLGHLLQCARCHDHKFDPIPTRDYYSLQAVFATTQLVERKAAFLPVENQDGFEEKTFLEARREEHLATLRRLDAKSVAAAETFFTDKKIDPAAWHAAVAAAGQAERKGGKRDFQGVFAAARTRMAAKGVPEDQYPTKLYGFTPDDYGNERVARKGLERIKWEVDRYQPIAFSVYDGRTPDVKSVTAPTRLPAEPLTKGELEASTILTGGDPFSPGAPVTPGLMSVITGFNPETATTLPTAIEGRRRALAEWITHPGNPLPARVMVNRIWQHHFNQPLAGNPNNFGATGRKPTHPELLDWLAATFIEGGWSVKAMHRLIMGSAAYQRAGVGSEPPRAASDQSAAGSNPSGQELGTSALNTDSLLTDYLLFKPRRLTAEELRDSMLAVSGELNPALGGIPSRPEINLEAALQPRQVMGTFAEAWQPNPLPAERHRRSIYTLKIRGQRDPFMEVFNEPGPDLSCEARDASTVTPQVFSLFNSEASLDRALAFATRLTREKLPPAATIERAFLLACGRPPGAAERAATLAHWTAMTARHRTLTFARPTPPREVVREAVEENTGEKFIFREKLHLYDQFTPDLKLADADATTRALADVCLVLFNSNEFAYLY